MCNCLEKWQGVVNGDNVASSMDALAPNCICESETVSPWSKAGPVMSEELLTRLITSVDTDPKVPGELSRAVLQNLMRHGVSTDRGLDADEAIERGMARVMNPLRPRIFFGYSNVSVANIRAVHSRHSQARPCVYDDAIEDNPRHAVFLLSCTQAQAASEMKQALFVLLQAGYKKTGTNQAPRQ